MICEACHGQQTFPPCPECGGCGIAHCCDGLVECSSASGIRTGGSDSEQAPFERPSARKDPATNLPTA